MMIPNVYDAGYQGQTWPLLHTIYHTHAQSVSCFLPTVAYQSEKGMLMCERLSLATTLYAHAEESHGSTTRLQQDFDGNLSNGCRQNDAEGPATCRRLQSDVGALCWWQLWPSTWPAHAAGSLAQCLPQELEAGFDKHSGAPSDLHCHKGLIQ